ncbi:MAG: DegT/DnrJ/EryC1/StrS family aminotransferase [Myxococcota bacterium]
MIPRFSPNYDQRDLRLCLQKAPGGATQALERAFCERTGHPEAIAFRYGRSALYHLLKALGHQGKKVILPAYTCVVVAHAVVRSGNIPVFLDCAQGRCQPHPMDYLRAIDAETVMIVPTHLYGVAEETRDLYQQVKEAHPGVFVLQDCAHSFFAETLDTAPVHRHADGCLYGMNISKLVNSVRGGMLTLRDMELAHKVSHGRQPQGTGMQRLVSELSARFYVVAAAFAFTPAIYELTYFLQKKTSWLNRETQYYSDHTIELPEDFDVAMSDFEATIGLHSLEKFSERVARRQEIASFYVSLLSHDADSASLPFDPEVGGYTWSHFPYWWMLGPVIVLCSAPRQNFAAKWESSSTMRYPLYRAMASRRIILCHPTWYSACLTCP